MERALNTAHVRSMCKSSTGQGSRVKGCYERYSSSTVGLSYARDVVVFTNWGFLFTRAITRPTKAVIQRATLLVCLTRAYTAAPRNSILRGSPSSAVSSSRNLHGKLSVVPPLSCVDSKSARGCRRSIDSTLERNRFR